MGTVSLPPPVAVATGEFSHCCELKSNLKKKKMNTTYGKGNDVMESYGQKLTEI